MRNKSYGYILDQFTEGYYKEYFLKFIELKKAKGEIICSKALYRMKFACNIFSKYNSHTVTKEMVDDAINCKIEERGQIDRNTLSTIRSFTIFMSIYFADTFVVPPKYVKFKPIHLHDFVFTEEELYRLIEIADSISKKSGTIKHQPFMLRILIGTGMRISEVFSLKIKDIDFSANTISVVNSKPHVSRLVPISKSIADAIRYYIEATSTSYQVDDLLFKSGRTGDEFCYEPFRVFFNRIIKEAGIQPRGGFKPTIHSLRHTFCTHSLKRMLASGMNFYSALPILSAYMGHVNSIDTEKYLHLTGYTAEEFNTMQIDLNSLIPEVHDEE